MRDAGSGDIYSTSDLPRVRDKCEFCPNGTAIYDTRHCIKCGELNPYNATSGQCQACPLGHIEGRISSFTTLKKSEKYYQEDKCNIFFSCIQLGWYTQGHNSLRKMRCRLSSIVQSQGVCAMPPEFHAKDFRNRN